MGDSQFGILIATLATFLSGLIGMLKFAVTRITKALDDNTKSNEKDAEAKLELAKQMAVFSTKLDHIGIWIEDHTPVNPPDAPFGRRQPTPARGISPFYGPEKKKG